jgi:metallo-beta-lactamase family protein
MKLTFIGADHEVTGSCYYLEACGKRFLVDCGMEQGKNVFENVEIPIPVAELDFVLLTHAHIDHSGRLPLLYARGYRGPVISTVATADLCDIMLRDSAHIQEFEAEWRNRRGKREGKDLVEPMYTMDDALGVIQNFEGHDYDEKFSLAEGLDCCFVDAGHLLGSASIELWITEKDVTKKLVFSGDIGNINQPIIRDPQYITDADYVIMESTYGDRSHGPVPDYVPALAKVIQETFDRGGNVVIPSFAVGRTQEILYFIRQIKEQDLVKGHGDFPVYVDSPLAIEATTVFQRNLQDCYDEDARALLDKGINPIAFSNLNTTVTSDESRAINFIKEPKVILSASGMCDAGRVRHHLKHNLWRQESTILFVGYQAVGTPGRSLVDGAESIRIFGEDIAVKAQILVLPGVSGHADDAGLMKWAGSFEKKPQMVFVCHGEDQVTETFAKRLQDELGYEAYAPYSGTVFDLAANAFIEKTQGVRIAQEEAPVTGVGSLFTPRPSKLRNRKARAVYGRLEGAGYRLMMLIRKYEGCANRDVAKFADQINALCDKWEK